MVVSALAPPNRMNAADIRDRVAAVVDPYLGRPLGAAVRGATIEAGEAVVRIVLGFPVGGYSIELTAQIAAELILAGWTGGVRLELSAEIESQGVQNTLKDLTKK